MSDTATVVVIGDALIDEIHADDGGVEEFVGGAALNVAVGLATLGVRTSLIAMVGDDADGARIRAFLDEHGVDLIPTIGPFGSSRGVSVRVDGEPTYVFNEAARNRRVRFGEAERAAMDAAQLVVVSCFPFDDVDQTDELLEAVRDPRRRFVVDVNPRESMMNDLEAFTSTFERLAPDTLLVKIGDDDSQLLYGESVDELRDRLHDSGSSVVLATAGREGAKVETADGELVSEPIADLPGPVVDTMGAGDATLASMVDSIVSDGMPRDAHDWHEALGRAMLIAAATCRHHGALLRRP